METTSCGGDFTECPSGCLMVVRLAWKFFPSVVSYEVWCGRGKPLRREGRVVTYSVASTYLS